MTDPAFKNAGKKPGLEIWRIEALKVVAVNDKTYGKFYSGDSYICLATEKVPGGNALRWDIHFWLGKDTSQDEAGAAAIKTVELDDSLGGGPVQYREVQEHESPQFQNLFKSFGGLMYLDGGVASGFKKVERDKYETRLFHVKGKRNVRVSSVPVSHKSLNKGDVFILDAGLVLYQWNGSHSSKSERQKGMETMKRISSDERGGRAQTVIIEDPEENADFWTALGGKGAVADAADDDEAFEKKKNAETGLYRVSDASGSMQTEKVASAPLKRDMLDSNDAFILDTPAQIFVWIGKKATKEEKNEAWSRAMAFIKEKNYPISTPCVRVVEGAETTAFIQQFVAWPQPQSSPNFRSNVAKVEQKAVDMGKMRARADREKSVLPDDGSGKLEVWRVEDFKKVPVDPKTNGQFYQGDSYVLLYTYNDAAGRENYIIYFWQGLDSSQDEKGASALLAKELDDSYGGAPVQVRVVQNKEPDHFLGLFKGKFIIHLGGKASGFKNSNQSDEYDTDGTSLFHVRGTTSLNTKAVQVAEVAASLNSNDCFVLQTPGQTYVWYGRYATGDEREVAKSIVKVVTGFDNSEAVMEGKEPEAFWKALGGKGPYTEAKSEPVADFEPRLFQCSNASGNFTVEEIFDFSQEDLVPDDVMLLDTGNEVFVWIGDGALPEEKKKALETAIDYIKGDPRGRDPETPILSVKQRFEPPLFTQHFLWDAKKAQGGMDDAEYEKLKASGAGVISATQELAKFSATYPYDTLLKRPLPDGVDASRLEAHLDDAEFQRVFKMDRAAYDALPAWKKTNKKKELRLF